MGYWKYVDSIDDEDFYFPVAFYPASATQTQLSSSSPYKTIIHKAAFGGFYTYVVSDTLPLNNLAACVTQSGPELDGSGWQRQSHDTGRWTGNNIISYVDTFPSPAYLRIVASDGATVAARYVGGIAWGGYSDVSVYEISTNYYCVVRIVRDYYGPGQDRTMQFILPRNTMVSGLLMIFNEVAARTITNTEVRSWKETHSANQFDDGENLWSVSYAEPPVAPTYTNLGPTPYFKYTKERIVMQQMGASLDVDGLMVRSLTPGSVPNKDTDLWAIKHTITTVNGYTTGIIDIGNISKSKIKEAAFSIPEEFSVTFPEGQTKVWANYTLHPVVSRLDYPHVVSWGGDFFVYNPVTEQYEQLISTLNWNYSKCELLNSESYLSYYGAWYPPFLYFWYQNDTIYTIVHDDFTTYSFYEYTEDRGRVTCGPLTTSGQKHWGKYGGARSWIRT